MTSIEDAQSWIGRTAVDNTGEQIGVITQIWVDDASGEAEWASVKVTGLRGREALVPLASAEPLGGGRRFAYSKEEIVDAPHAGQDGRFDAADKEALSSYYGAPDTGPKPGPTWISRLEDARDGATEREIGALQGADGPAAAPQAPAPEGPAPQAPVEQKARRRFGRKSAPST